MYGICINKSASHLHHSHGINFAGAGNIIDSIFYGRLFSSSEFGVATFMPDAGGCAGWLHGKVVDMFLFPIIQTHYPQWFPFWGGEEFIFSDLF